MQKIVWSRKRTHNNALKLTAAASAIVEGRRVEAAAAAAYGGR